MFFPFADDNPSKGTPLVTYAIIASNVLILIVMGLMPPLKRQEAIYNRGFMPARIAQLTNPAPIVVGVPVQVRHPRFGVRQMQHVIRLEPNPGEIALSLLTCMFMHAGWWHLISNMWFLGIFGNNVENRLGHVAYLLFYLVGGLLASACHWMMDPTSTTPIVGASGAVAAVLGAYAITWPWARIHTLMILVVVITIIDLPALWVLGVWFLIELMQAVQQADGGVAWWAHVGGFAAGVGLILLLDRALGLPKPSWRRSPQSPEIPTD
jgi:membrane associated rhomboid family serine protease